ncbi:hypothetical protein DFJ77DRAFT_478390, partial [Powellomyces hirtus]
MGYVKPYRPYPEGVCIWTTQIHHCRDATYFIVVYYVSAVISFLFFLVGCGALYRRCIVKKLPIWRDGLTTLDSHVFVMTFGCFFLKTIYNLVLAGGLYRHSGTYMLFTNLLHHIQWGFGRIGGWLYILSIASSTPPHSVVWLPTKGAIRLTRWAAISFEISLLPFVIRGGQTYDSGDMVGYRWNEAVCWSVCCINNILTGFAYGIFGRQLVRIAEVSAQEVKSHAQSALETKATVNPSSTQANQMQKAITKMKVFNYAFMSIFLWFGVVVGLFALYGGEMLELRWVSIPQSFGTVIGTPCLAGLSLMAVAWGEIQPKEDDAGKRKHQAIATL